MVVVVVANIVHVRVHTPKNYPTERKNMAQREQKITSFVVRYIQFCTYLSDFRRLFLDDELWINSHSDSLHRNVQDEACAGQRGLEIITC